jgi:carbon monoxide dehydrogenase subunit G
MFRISSTREISAPPDEVWAVLCDTEQYAEWVPGTDAVTRTDGTAALGVTYDEITPIVGPWKARTGWRVTEFDKGRRIVHTSDDIPLARTFHVVQEVLPTSTCSQVTISMHAVERFGPVGWPFARAMTPQVRKDNERSLVNLANRLTPPAR